MLFGKKKNWDDVYDEDYAKRTERRERLRGSVIWFQLAAFLVVGAIGLGAIALFFGRTMVEKVLTELAAPVGLVWMFLLFQTYLALLFRQGGFAILTIACWLLLTIFGNSYVANQLACGLEEPHFQTELNRLPELDVVFLLGGGTDTNRQGRAQAGISGDRVVAAASLYHNQKTKLIVCTGEQSFRTTQADLDPHEEAYSILRSLEVPEEAIAMLRGKNTSEEMHHARLFLEQQKMPDAKIGIVTSAWHLNRAGRLAKNNGLDPVLIPADFRSKYFTNGPNLVIPSAYHLDTSARCIKEHLAAIIGR